MTVDARILLGLQPMKLDSPVNALAQIAQLQAARQQAEAGALELQTKRQALTDDATARRVYSESTDDASLISGLNKAGLGKQAMTVREKLAELAEKQTQAQRHQMEASKLALGSKRDLLTMVQNPQQMAQWMQAGYADPLTKPLFEQMGPLDRSLENIPTEPAAFQTFLQKNAMGFDAFIKDQTSRENNAATNASRERAAATMAAGANMRANQRAQVEYGINALDPTTAPMIPASPLMAQPRGLPAAPRQVPASVATPAAPALPIGGRSVPPSVQAGRDSERLRILQEELAKEQDPASRQAIQAEISRLSPGPSAALTGASPLAGIVEAIGTGKVPAETALSGLKPGAKAQVLAELQQRFPNYDPAKVKAAGTAAKPLPTAIAKQQNEELQAVGTFAGLNADLAALGQQLESGKLKLGPVSNLANEARNLVGMSTEESRNLASFKAKLENLRNGVLLLNKGVQTEGDAKRAMNEILANPNDTRLVAQRLREIQALNERAVELRKNQVNQLRAEFGHPPMDFGKFQTQPASVGLGKRDIHAEAEAILRGK
ncbi:hypothetical protein [Piscinibacter koreensis]|uniref:Uncharacterized protein n=1 Tax=Piscinibacter koreensis TaxID=2742824 RepID=A0A7Y6TX20_9BURK|nr:hypothetical protein [Schlegelella koreensis]NUZ06739.1 hypothetical protein [Schlegelella koreensis]